MSARMLVSATEQFTWGVAVAKYEILFELKPANQKGHLEPVIIEATDITMNSDWVTFQVGGATDLFPISGAFPRDKIFGYRMISNEA